MKNSRVTLVCTVCSNSFEVIDSRKDKAKYCSAKCSQQSRIGSKAWNSGLTYLEMYGDRADEIRKKSSQPKEKNGMYGRTHTEEVRQKLRDSKLGKPAHNRGAKYPQLWKNIDRTGENNAYVKAILRERGISYCEYLSYLTDKERYFLEVTKITRMQPIVILENYEKRGKAGIEGAYHLDHIYPISKGFDNKIPVEIIGDISNLRFIPWEENLRKGNRLDYEDSFYN